MYSLILEKSYHSSMKTLRLSLSKMIIDGIKKLRFGLVTENVVYVNPKKKGNVGLSL